MVSTHPQATFIPPALAPDHPHSSAYHSFLTSPYLPTSSTSSTTTKKRSRATAPALAPPVPNAIDANVLHHQLLSWFDTVKEEREMPWRKEVEIDSLSKEERSQRGYEVWVSEIMLQQTQVVTVKAYFARWMKRFPTVAALAASSQDDVHEAWKGLGYYSRATRLLAGAKTVMRDFKGRMPETAAELEKIDGIGPYSAGAISSIAFARRSPMVDGNVTRVLSRMTALHAVQTAKATTTFVWALADVLVPSSSSPDLEVGGPNKPGAWNQALMELGATVCTPKGPKCGECPLKDECLARAEVRFAKTSTGTPAPPPPPSLRDLEECHLCSPIEDLRRSSHAVTVYPMAKERKKQREEETAVCVLEWVPKDGEKGKGRKVLLVKRPEKGLLAGLYEFPAVDLPPSTSLSSASTRQKYLDSLLSSLLLDPPTPSTTLSTTPLAPITHIYSHIIQTYLPTRLVLSSPTLPRLAPSSSSSSSSSKLLQSLAGRAKWIDATEVADANVGGAVGKIWEERERDRKGLPMPKVKSRSAPKEVVRVAKGAGAKGKGGRKGKKEDEYETESEAEESGGESSESEAEETGSEKEEERKPEVVVDKKPYKKRRIVISDEEDEE